MHKKDSWSDPASPKPTSGYKLPENCELFSAKHVRAGDVVQGSLANCYFISTLAALAEKKPTFIREMIKEIGDNKYAVCFFHEGKPRWIKVDGDLPQKLNTSKPLYAQTSDSDKDGRPEIWAPLIEKAYARFREKYPLPGKEDRQGYQAMHFGHAHIAYEALTGLKGKRVELVDKLDKSLPPIVNSLLRPSRQDDLWNYACGVNRGHPIVAGTGDFSENPHKKLCAGLIGKHVYTVLKTFTRNGDRFVQLRNPWGSGEPRLNHDGTNDGVFVMRWNDFMKTFCHLSGRDR
ncbi:MAG: C2 family cysteine protease [Myxococcota bacterium]|nr:C2 family cysteine protease [Myxococcota bacterium]